jgi:rhodanese-related sulfurtransferase
MQHGEGFLRLVEQARPRVREVSIEQVRAEQQNGAPFRLIDVREESEWAAGHLPGAEHMGRGVLERDIEARIPDPRTPLVLYCGGGYRSVLAAESLQRMGYGNVRSMSGGFRGWRDAGLPLEE